jgi:hypothetical protein
LVVVASTYTTLLPKNKINYNTTLHMWVMCVVDIDINKYTTRKKINSDRHSEALQWNRRRSSIWRPLLRRFWTAAANKQILTGHPRRFKCVPQRIRKSINANFILPLSYSLSQDSQPSHAHHHRITSSPPHVPLF